MNSIAIELVQTDGQGAFQHSTVLYPRNKAYAQDLEYDSADVWGEAART